MTRHLGLSPNGKAADSDSVIQGSNPCSPAGENGYLREKMPVFSIAKYTKKRFGGPVTFCLAGFFQRNCMDGGESGRYNEK